MRRYRRNIHDLASILKVRLKDAVVALCRFSLSFYACQKKLLYAVGKTLGFVKGDAVISSVSDESIAKRITHLAPYVCPVMQKHSVGMRFMLSIGDGLLDARLEERA